MANVKQYHGVIIFRNDQPGYALRYTARSKQGDPLAANTLAGMKRLIRESLGGA